MLWRWTPPWDRPFTAEQIATLPPLPLAHLERYGWQHGDVIRASLDDSRFINHSKSPNSAYSTGRDESIATRLIRAEEEIFEDYSQFDPDFESYAATLTGVEPEFAPIAATCSKPCSFTGWPPCHLKPGHSGLCQFRVPPDYDGALRHSDAERQAMLATEFRNHPQRSEPLRF